MKKARYLILCTLLTVAALFSTACGNKADMNETQAPYEDATKKKVNNKNTNNGTMTDDLKNSGSNLKDAGENLIDSVQDAGDAIMDGVDNLTNDKDNANNNHNNNNANTP